MRFIGTNCSRCRFCSGLRTFNISVSIGPGCTEFTRILRGARSIAAALVIPLSTHFVALYAIARRSAKAGGGRYINNGAAARLLHQWHHRLHPNKTAELIDPHVTLEELGVGLHQCA